MGREQHTADSAGQPRRARTWARCLGYGLTALGAAAGWLFLGLVLALSAVLGEYDDAPPPPEWVLWIVLALPALGGIALVAAGVCAGLGRRREAWWALRAVAFCLASWVPVALLAGG